jgi:adenylate kinase family enzyme
VSIFQSLTTLKKLFLPFLIERWANHIHILGASGSGTTTLAQELCRKLQFTHFDTDDYLWKKTESPFTKIRKAKERIALLQKDLSNCEKWILSGSLCGWGDVFIPYFDLVVFLYIPPKIRLERLLQREKKRHGNKILPGNILHKTHIEFMNWAAKYDEGDSNMRSKQSHEKWLEKLTCNLLRIEEDMEIKDKINLVKTEIINAKEMVQRFMITWDLSIK